MRELMVRDAIREALDEEMARDNTVFQMGEDIGVIGGNFKCTVGLRDKYGDLRVKDTPISEQGFVGMGVGAALTGLRPVVELMFADFMMVCGDQLFNQMAKITYMSGGQCNVPMVVRLPLGGGRSSAAQHSQSIHAWAAHIPGVKVVVPSTAGECKGLLKTAIRDNDPVMIFEHKMLYTTKFNDVPEVEEDVCIPFGQARIVTEGADITVVTNSMMTIKAEKAVRQLQKEGISAELIDLRTIVPLDTETIIRSVKKTGKLLIVDEGHLSFGITGEIASRIMPDVFYDLDAPIQRMVPMLAIYLFQKINGWGIHELGHREKRFVPYALTIISYVTCLITMYKIHLPRYMSGIIVAALICMILCTLINFKWKISTHVASSGMMVGGLLSYSFIFNFNPVWWLCFFILLSGMLGTARIIVKQHTLLEVLAGFIVGLFCGVIGILFI